MAASPSLTGSRTGPVAALGTGEFGSRVAGFLADITDDGAVCVDDLHSAFRSTAPLVVLAAWRPSPRLCEEADQQSFLAGKPWLPVVMDHPVLRVGPLVRPPQAPCFRCFARRQAQHDGEHRSSRMLYAEYDRDDRFGPRGYLPQHARVAAAVVAGVLNAWRTTNDDGAAVPVGEVREIRLSDQRLTTSRVVPCHDCQRCAPPGSAGPVGQIQSLVTRFISGHSAGSEVGHR